MLRVLDPVFRPRDKDMATEYVLPNLKADFRRKLKEGKLRIMLDAILLVSVL